ncbi:MAG: hypothetical protein GX418_10965, partial [Clostridiales bacterium]|nr:hypothetical protein [Clostridiales bacterium]
APEVTETEAPASEPGATVLCPVCGTENPAHLSFCGECGGKLPVRAASDGVAAAARETKASVQAETREDMQAEEPATVQNRRTGHLPRVEPDFEPIFSADGETAGWSYTDTAEPNPSAYEAAEEGTQPSGAAPETPVAARAAYLASPEDGARESETPYTAYPRDSQAGYEEGAAKAVWDERPNVIARATRTVRPEAAASAEPEAAGWHGNAAAGYDREPDDRAATGAHRATGRAHPQAASQSEYWATEPHAAQARATAQTAAHSAAANRPAEAPGRASYADRAGWGASGEPAAPTRPEMSRTIAAASVAAAETPTPPAAGVRADRDAATGPNAGRTDPRPAMAQMARATETLAAPPHRPQSLPDERLVRAVAAVPAWGEGTAAPLRPPVSGFDHGATATMAQPAKASSPRADEKASPISGMAGKGRGQPHIVTTIQRPAMETATAPDPGTGPSTAASGAETPTDERAGLAPARTPATPRPRIVSTMGKNRT